MCLRPVFSKILAQQVYQPLGNQPLELSAFKELPSGDAHRKAEEGKERSSPALLGAAQEVAPTGEHGCTATLCNEMRLKPLSGQVRIAEELHYMSMAAATRTLEVRHCLGCCDRST